MCKDDFVEAFPPENIFDRLLHKASIFSNLKLNTQAAYVQTKLTLLTNLRVK